VVEVSKELKQIYKIQTKRISFLPRSLSLCKFVQFSEQKKPDKNNFFVKFFLELIGTKREAKILIVFT